MTLLPYFLVFLSSFLHAYWNFLVKQRHGTQVFIGLSKVSELILFGVPFIVYAQGWCPVLLQNWPLYTIGAALSLANYIFLGGAYARGDLSVVYPIARAGALVFLPLLAFVTIHERINAVGIAALLIIIAGCTMLQLKSFSWSELSRFLHGFCNAATALALLAALTTAGYSLWDKNAVTKLPAFLYFYSYTAIVAITYFLYLLFSSGARALRTEIRRNALAIPVVGILNVVTYLLVLFALQQGKATYVIALRQLSIPIGALLGWRFLGEAATLPNKVAVGFIAFGCLLVSLAK